eukprot:TRINITY_DN1039_c0_g1_i2.p1 TRINITY_DN1039_c0_g1~~TRINITY_DN1039_c0_g1_i2.p1  ORF type:complete len:1086 (+),score=228.67 TRINITY_DN1039_c0_g1_i2:104-3361(+)
MGFISIQSLTLTLSVCLVIISGGLTGYMSISTGENALDSTREMYEKGLKDTEDARSSGMDSCFQAGTSNSEELAGQLMEKVTESISARLQGYLQVPLGITKAASYFGSLIKPCFNAQGVYQWDTCPYEDKEWVDNVLSPFVYSLYLNGRDSGVTEVMYLWLPYDVVNVRLYLHIPFTHTAAVRANLSIPDDYRQTGVVSWPRATECGRLMDKQTCQTYSKVPPMMSEADWRAGGDYPGTGRGCAWCTRDKTLDAAKTLPYADPLYSQEGVCLSGNTCPYGFKPHPNYVWRPWFTIHTPPDPRGVAVDFGPCGSIVEAAQGSGRTPMTCEVPAVLQRFDLTLFRALTQAHHSERRDVLWSNPQAKGPMVSIQAYSSWSHPLQWDYGDGYGHTQGLIMAGVDLVAISDIMANMIGPLARGTHLYAVQQDPWQLKGAPTNYVCKDDPHGLIMAAGFSCPLLVNVLGLPCGIDLNKLNDRMVKPYNYLGAHCPVSCDECPTDGGEGLLIGTSHGVAYSPTPLKGSAYEEQGLVDKYPIHVTDAVNPVVRTHGRHVMTLSSALGTAYHSLATGELSEWWYYPANATGTIKLAAERTMNVSDEGDEVLYWVMPRHLDDEYGLRMTIILLIPRDEAMKTIDIATAKTRTEAEQAAAAVRSSIDKASAETNDEKEFDFMIMLIVVVVACLILIAISICFVFSIIKPLLLLQVDMSEVALMKLENVDLARPASQLEEVGHMQNSFVVMVKNLIEYRNYMPQSILCGDDEEEEEEEERQGTGATPSSPKASSRGGTSSGGDRNKSSKQSIAMSKRSNFSRVEIAQKKFAGGPEELKKRPVSFCSFNLSGWHALLADKGDLLTATHSNYLSKAIAKITSTKGIPDTFCGDRIIGTFNGVKPCATHRAQAPLCGAGFLAQMKTEHPAMRITCATVSGDCKFGNMGCTGAKRFTFVGGTYTWACALERFCASIGTGILCDKWICSEAQNSLHVRIAAVVYFAKRAASDQVVHEILGEKAVSEDEWMYQLEEAAANDPHAAWNSFVAAVIEKRFDNAKEAMIKLEETLASGGGPPEAVLKMFQDAVRREEFESTPLLYH